MLTSMKASMRPSVWQIIFLGLLSLPIYRAIYSVVRKYRIISKSRKFGCLSPPTLRNSNFLNLTILRDSIKAAKDDRGPEYFVNAMNSLGIDVHTCRVPILDYEILCTRDPENIRVLYCSSDFDISETRSKSWMPLMGQGIFTGRGDVWKHSRALVRPQFTRENIADMDLAEQHVQELMKTLTTGEDGWTRTIDLQPLFYNFTLDIVTQFLYGRSANSQAQSLEGSMSEGKTFGRHLDAAKSGIERRGALAKFYWLLNSKDFKMSCKGVQEYVDRHVQTLFDHELQSLGLDEDDISSGMDKPKFVLLRALAYGTRDPIKLRNETLHVLVAGRDTTGALLGWIFYFLARHPAVYHKMRSEVLSELGTSGDVPFRKLKSLQYLHNTIREVMRVAAVLPLNERVALRDTVLPRGGGPDGLSPVFVPKGVQILIPMYAVQHRADIWGDDAGEFNPDRWEHRKPGFEFAPFGAGPRKCLGQEFALTKAAFVVVRIAQRFDKLENMEAPGRIRHHHAIENRSGTGVCVRLHAS